MFRVDEVPSFYIEDYRTLHNDIGLVQRSNGLWDLWFGQDSLSENYKDETFLNIIDGDIVSATEIHSLQVGIIISCLTSWNYLNRTGNPVYPVFGNESYSLLKKNKGSNTQYKIKHFFIDCLNRMRRIYSVEYLDVSEVENNPYLYKVKFKVISITNTIVDGDFYLNLESNKNTSVIDIAYNHPYTSISNPLFIECELKDEYGSLIENEILYIYIKHSNEDEFKFYGITESTNHNGKTYVTIPPKGLLGNIEVMFVFRGNTLYNPSMSKIINIQNVAYYIKSKYTYKTIENDDGEEIEVIDKQILYVEDSLGNSLDKFRLGELLSDYTNLENISLTETISLEDIQNNKAPNQQLLEYDEENYEDNKLYLIPTTKKIEGTNKFYYHAYLWNDDGETLSMYPSKNNPCNVQLNTNNPYEVHFLIDDGDNGLFEIDFEDGHLYYQMQIYENEM